MPIGPFEQEILRILAGNRNPESFVARATVLNQSPQSPRASEDIDLFHDSEEVLQASVTQDEEVLRGHGYEMQTVFSRPNFHRARVLKSGEATKMEWVHDSAFRFFLVDRDAPYGCFFLGGDGKPQAPFPDTLESLFPHYGSLRGCWPHVVEE
jgi:hypothetical protein